jgi:ankyrin repeat protein
LISHNANVAIKDNEGHTPLHEAAFFELAEVFETLLSHGANVTVKNYKGQTPLNLSS